MKKTLTVTLNKSDFEQYQPSSISVKVSEDLTTYEVTKIVRMLNDWLFKKRLNETKC